MQLIIPRHETSQSITVHRKDAQQYIVALRRYIVWFMCMQTAQLSFYVHMCI